MRSLLLSGLVVASSSAGCRGAPPHEPEETVTPVRLVEISRAPVDRPIRGTGVLRLKREIDLSFKVGGIVQSVLVEEGAKVKKGQLLARLDPTEVDAALRQAMEGTVKAERDLERVKKLHASGAVPIAELQNAETGLALARAGTDAAAFNASRSAIVAPDDGRIDRRLVETGEVVAPGRPIYHMSGQSKGAVVRIGVTDRDVLCLHEGDKAKVVLDARPGSVLDGAVAQIATVASPGSGTFDVEVRIGETAEAVFSGLTAKVKIAHVEEVAAMVPIGAVAFGAREESSVFIVGPDTRARRVKVRVGFIDGDRVAIRKDDRTLDAQSRIIEAGVSQLEDGSRVRVVP